MPMYIYKCEECEEEVAGIREVEDRDQLPEDPCPKCNATKWRRILCAPTIRKGFSWGPGKGYW
jgi:putative FmdB family regulatory protein